MGALARANRGSGHLEFPAMPETMKPGEVGQGDRTAFLAPVSVDGGRQRVADAGVLSNRDTADASRNHGERNQDSERKSTRLHVESSPCGCNEDVR